MQNDLELLKLAAKAAGYAINFDEPLNGYYPYGYDDEGDVEEWWNPLHDDGDALRLAVDAGVLYWAASEFQYLTDHGPDKMATMRRVLVEFAAEVGKAL